MGCGASSAPYVAARSEESNVGASQKLKVGAEVYNVFTCQYCQEVFHTKELCGHHQIGFCKERPGAQRPAGVSSAPVPAAAEKDSQPEPVKSRTSGPGFPEGARPGEPEDGTAVLKVQPVINKDLSTLSALSLQALPPTTDKHWTGSPRPSPRRLEKATTAPAFDSEKSKEPAPVFNSEQPKASPRPGKTNESLGTVGTVASKPPPSPRNFAPQKHPQPEGYNNWHKTT